MTYKLLVMEGDHCINEDEPVETRSWSEAVEHAFVWWRLLAMKRGALKRNALAVFIYDADTDEDGSGDPLFVIGNPKCEEA